MKRNQLIFFMFLIAAMVFLAACNDDSTETSGSDSGEDEEITLEFWTMQLQPTFTDYINGMIDDFEADNPNITINWLDVPAGDLEQKILADVSAGNAPDLVNLNPSFGGSLAELDATVNMDEALSDEEIDRYVEGAWEASQLDGETFGIPWYLDTAVTLNNADIYEEAGLDPSQPPETYEEAKEYAEIISEETDKYGYFPSLDLSLPLQHMELMGVPLTNEDGTAAFNTPDGVEVFEYFTELYENNLIPAESLTGDQREGTNFYQSGQVAFGVNFFIAEIEENAPDIYDSTVPSVAITGDSGKKTMSVQNLVVPEQSEHQEAAVDFGLFITSAENQLEFAQLTPILPSSTEALEDPYFTDPPEDADPLELVRITSAEQLPDAELLVPPMDNLNELQTVMYDGFSKAMLGELSPEEALAETEEKWNEIVAE
ncbi:putative chitobiose transport system substrate-binding protein [Virgibacillus natechei]|uniref:Chitobiose transport system substrate-binding protein n=1 Tax=Virgibacillus natechei TaxID=1216297 RepID=A0ABS4IM99_9BACI|nr:sugar ABC transporter substrate-binding protein [Virgibacillus natechei]MBP1971546.1 putative chitobiose transport system substrate-binding protein [Virgibacillus natechei]UZD11984.1 sugar ABC transporter substrate-binding protein [Virgibacillus natechei]